MPPIGMTVERLTGGWWPDWVALVRIGDEQNVAVWGSEWPRVRRFSTADVWRLTRN